MPMPMLKISTILIGVSDLNNARPFYEKAFGFVFDEFRPPFASATFDEIEFNIEENADRWLLNNGLLDNKTSSLLKNTNTLPLHKSIFYEDALVFKNLQSTSISLKSKKSNHGLDFKFEGYPYFGIWAAKDADFICLEPWHGIADDILANQQLKEKEGINALLPGNEFYCDYSVSVF